MLKLLVLTGSKRGTAAHHLPYLIENDNCEISSVIYNRGEISNKKKYYRRKVRKIFGIGILGALNGIRMRKWYNEDLREYIRIKDLENLCEENKLPFYTTPTINCKKTVDLFTKANADIGLSLGNGYINKRIFSIPEFGMINIHHELLPEYQNAQSVIWQLYNNSKKTGYTIHKVTKNIDGGDILFKKEVPITFEDSLSATVTKTYATLLEESALGLSHILENFSEFSSNANPQNNSSSYTTPSIWQYWKIYRNFKELKNR